MCNYHLLLLLLLLAGGSLLGPSESQPTAVPPAASPLDCNGILLSYNLQSWSKIRPFAARNSDQAYSFKATGTILNNGAVDLRSWAYLINFNHREIIVSATNAVISDGSSFPYNTTTSPGQPTSFSGFPNTDLKTPIETANDLTQIQAQIELVGTLFGATNRSSPLPTSLSLDDPSYICPKPTINDTQRFISTCCMPNPDFKPNTTLVADEFLPRRTGDITIDYDVVQSFDSSYLALVTIRNHNELGRLDNWRLSWEWMRGEFIFSTKGAYPSLVTVADCIGGPQGNYYKNFDFSKVLNCQKKPTIVDLPPTRFNDTDLGKIPNCCRNGTILPPSMDSSQSASAFQMQVFKMPPDVNKTKLFPPQNWQISGSATALNPDYKCGPPVRVSPSSFPDPSGLDSSTAAVASWQVVCNITVPKDSKPRCCVSFSSYYNDSVVPCKTCACGCGSTGTCNATAPALLLPPQASLVPFDNRTALVREWAGIKHFNVPLPLPCGDNCGVSINWHVLSDYSNGWTARVTLFNWEDVNFANWFAAVKMEKAYEGFEAMYSFNASAVGNNTIFMQGLPDFNYLVAETNGQNEGEPRVPGKQQSVISFTKKNTPGINVVTGDGFPSKVFFNGEECSLPDIIPTSGGIRSIEVGNIVTIICIIAVAVLMMLNQ